MRKGLVAAIAAALIMLGGGAFAVIRAPAHPCHASGALPDRHCTPGATNTFVTQDNIRSTICVSGWTATIRPPQSVTAPIKFERMKAYGVKVPNELDHLLPLELGGATKDVANLWPEAYAPVPGAHEKDAVEFWLNRQVCANKMTLAEAQREMASDWTAIHRSIPAQELIAVPIDEDDD